MSEQVSDSPVIFAYDGLSRRTKITEYTNGTVTSKKLYWWLGGSIACERDGLVSGFPITKRYFGQGVLQGTTKLFYTTDHLGSVRELVDDAGTVQAQYRYSTYGERTKETGNLESDWGYAGLWHHAPSGLDLATYRLYDAANKRWISRDPLGEGVDYNLYRYCGNSPINVVDPDGLEPIGDVGGRLGPEEALLEGRLPRNKWKDPFDTHLGDGTMKNRYWEKPRGGNQGICPLPRPLPLPSPQPHRLTRPVGWADDGLDSKLGFPLSILNPHSRAAGALNSVLPLSTAIVEEAGNRIRDLSRQPLRYNDLPHGRGRGA